MGVEGANDVPLEKLPLSGLLLEGSIFLAMALCLCSSFSEGLAGPHGETWHKVVAVVVLRERRKIGISFFLFRPNRGDFGKVAQTKIAMCVGVVHGWEEAKTKDKKEDKKEDTEVKEQRESLRKHW